MTRGSAFRGAIFGLVWVGVWASPACKSNEVNQTSIANTNNNITYTTVGPSGATVPGPEGTKIRIPAGALDEDTEIAIVEAKPGEYPEPMIPTTPPTPLAVQGKVWAFLPHGLTFYVDPTFTVPAPAGEWGVWKSQPGGQWMGIASTTSSGGFVQFKSSTFSFYAVAQFGAGGSADAGDRDAVPPPGDGGGGKPDGGTGELPDASVGDTGGDPCKACIDNCTMKCSGNPTCRNNCINLDCAAPCGTGGDGGTSGGDSSTGADTSGGGTPVCNDGVVTAPETCDDGNAIGGDGCSSTCQVEAGYSCPPTGGMCTPTSSCPTKTQPVSGSGTFSGSMTVADGYAFYKQNLLGSDYYSQLWIDLTDKPGACTRSVSRQGGSSSKTFRIRLEATKTTTPYVFGPGTYASGSSFTVISDGLTTSSTTCSTTPGTPTSGGTVTITSTAGGRYVGTFSFPSPAVSGSFDLPVCPEDNPTGGVPPECCK